MAVAATKEERREKKAKAPTTDAPSDGSSGPRVNEENPDPDEVPKGQDPPAEVSEKEDKIVSPRKSRPAEVPKRSRAGPCAKKVCGTGATCIPTEETRRGFKCQCGTGPDARLMPPAFPCPTKSSQHRTRSRKEDRPRQRRRQGNRGQAHATLTSASSPSSSSSLSSSSNSLFSSDSASSLPATPDRKSVCENSPCGKEPACHPDDTNPRGFICVCVNSSHVQPGAPCEHTIVNATPSAVPLPLQNASGFQTRALQKSGGLQNTGALHNTRLQEFELKSPGPLGVASSSGLGMALMFCLATLMLLLLSAIAFWRRKTIADVVRRRRRVCKASAQVLPMSLMKDRNFASNPNYYAEPLEPTSPFQALAVQLIDKEQISFVGQLGEGCFGKVYKGVYGPRDVEGRAVGGQTVAVKVLKESAGGEAEADFLREVEIMAAFTHTNILTLVGIVAADSGGPPWMVFEYMALGDLAELLRSRSPEYRTDDSLSKTMTKEDLVSVSVQIAAGMTYLSSQHFVHRDLACRNCLVGDNLAVKISDFGMSRDIYTCDYYKMGGSRMLPVRWMSPESLVYGKFTLESDVWSFGVVLWEIYAFGKQPYYGHTNEEVLKLILQGILLQPPKGCPPPICDVMRKCWSSEARDRLQFSQIEELLLKIQKGTDPSRVASGMLDNENKSLSPEQVRHLDQAQQQHLQQEIDRDRAWGGVTYSELMAQAEGEAVDADDYLMPRVHPAVEYLTVLNVD